MFFVLGFSFQPISNFLEQLPTFLEKNPYVIGIIAIATAVGTVLIFFDNQLGVISSILEKLQEIQTQWGGFRKTKVPQEAELLEIREKLLKGFSIKLEKRLDDILSDDQLIALSYEQRYEQIGRVQRGKVTPEITSRQEPQWQTTLKILESLRWLWRDNQEPEELAPDKKLTEVFWEEHGRLFILGAPGSGKTTTLLELAQELVEVAKADEKNKTPIPIIFELSNWKSDQQSIEQFLVAQLKEEFQISLEIGKYWVKTNQILPLFDGLDEVGVIRLPLCVEKLNEFLPTGEPDRLAVVCCRTKEFKLGQKKLYKFNGAVELQGLNDGQIKQYLKNVKQPSLWEEKIKPSPELTDLARTPLMLTVMAVTLSRRSAVTRAELFSAYIQERFKRYQSEHPNQKLLYSSEQTCQYLQRLAWQLKNESQTAFLIEGLQPKNWLQNIPQILMYLLIVGLMLGLIAGLIIGLIAGLITGLIVGLMLGLIAGLVGGLDDIEPIEILELSWQRVAQKKFFTELIRGLITGLIVGLIVGLINGLKSDITIRSKPNQGILASAKNSIILTCFGGVLAVLINLFLPALLTYVVLDPDHMETIMKTNIFAALFLFLFVSGGLACMQHLALRVVLCWSGAMPWNYAAFLKYTSELRLTRQTGGEFRFLHDLLREHFAEGYLNPENTNN